jgi:N-acetyltransferase B complex (NatB) non catalytic subunit
MSILEEKSSRRNFALGTIHFAYDLEDQGKAGIGSPLEHCIRYFKQNASKNACFGDLQSSVSFLSGEDQQIFLKEIKAFSQDDTVPHSPDTN